MPSKRIHPLGIYEKALPNDFSFEQKFKAAKEAGFDFLEISVDESDSKLAYRRADSLCRHHYRFSPCLPAQG